MEKIKKGRWIYIPLGLIIFMCMGTVYSWSIFRKPIQEAFNIGATQSALPFTLFLVSYSLGMPVAGGLIEKHGPRIMTIVGGLVVGLGWLLAGFSNNIILLAIKYGVIGGIGVGIAYGAPMAVAARWFPDKKGLAVGLTLGGFGLSPFVTAPLANRLLLAYGPFQTFKILGLAFAIIIPILALPLKFPDKELKSKRNEEDNQGIKDVNSKAMMKTGSFYGLWGCYVLGTAVGLMTVGISSPVAMEIVKLDQNKAALMVSLFAVFNGIGRPIFGIITDKLKPQKAAIISYSLMILAAILMLNVGEGNILLYGIAFSIFFLNLGGWLAIAPAATGIFFGTKYYSKNYGFLFTAYGVGAILGNTVAGELRDIFGSFVYTFYPAIGLAVIGIVIAKITLKEK